MFARDTTLWTYSVIDNFSLVSCCLQFAFVSCGLQECIRTEAVAGETVLLRQHYRLHAEQSTDSGKVMIRSRLIDNSESLCC